MLSAFKKRLLFGEHTILFVGSMKNNRAVRHQAYCVVFNPFSEIELRTINKTTKSNLIIVPSLLSHQILCEEGTLFLFIDPYCTFSINQASQLENKKLDIIVKHLSVVEESIDIDALDKLVSASVLNDERINSSISFIKSNLHKTISTEELTSVSNLSESRLQHRFKEQIGMPIRKYIHWQRIVASTKSIVEGNQLTQAAYAGGFADGAHFTRTFKKMFGVPPSFFFRK